MATPKSNAATMTNSTPALLCCAPASGALVRLSDCQTAAAPATAAIRPRIRPAMPGFFTARAVPSPKALMGEIFRALTCRGERCNNRHERADHHTHHERQRVIRDHEIFKQHTGERRDRIDERSADSGENNPPPRAPQLRACAPGIPVRPQSAQ